MNSKLEHILELGLTFGTGFRTGLYVFKKITGSGGEHKCQMSISPPEKRGCERLVSPTIM
jgi:hypothetical protein